MCWGKAAVPITTGVQHTTLRSLISVLLGFMGTSYLSEWAEWLKRLLRLLCDDIFILLNTIKLNMDLPHSAPTSTWGVKVAQSYVLCEIASFLPIHKQLKLVRLTSKSRKLIKGLLLQIPWPIRRYCSLCSHKRCLSFIVKGDCGHQFDLFCVSLYFKFENPEPHFFVCPVCKLYILHLYCFSKGSEMIDNLRSGRWQEKSRSKGHVALVKVPYHRRTWVHAHAVMFNLLYALN